jgi:pyruvate kinase
MRYRAAGSALWQAVPSLALTPDGAPPTIAAMRKTKIVCTLGPSTEDPGVLRGLLEAGMNVARFNTAHGDEASHAAMIARLREASSATSIPVALLIDIKGPEIRTGAIAGGAAVELRAGDRVTVTADDAPCTAERISVSYRDLPEQVAPGHHILIADGTIDMEVVAVEGGRVQCTVRAGGALGSHKNVNVPGIKNRLPAVTERDAQYLRFAVGQDMDFVAASFVRRAEHVLEIRQRLLREGSRMHIIAKIEDAEGVENIDEILRVSDGIMVARGDLGVQMPAEQVPLVQKRIILKCHEQNKAVITATQMLDSMIENPRPTRAEASDVANAIFDGSDAVMLSGETANGRWPLEAVRVMHSIAGVVEDSPEYESRVRRYFRLDEEGQDIAQSVTRSAFLVAREIDAAAIVVPTLRGNTPRRISKYRPSQPVLAVTPSEAVLRRLLLYWGVQPILCDLADSGDVMQTNALAAALSRGYIKTSDTVVVLAGVPVNSPIMVNTIRVHFIGTVLGKGERGFGGWRSGKIVRVQDSLEAELRLKHDDTEILVARFLTPDFLPLLAGLRGIVLEESSWLSPEQIRSVAPDIAAIGIVPGAMTTLEDGLTVTLHGDERVVYEGIVEGGRR